MKKLINKLFIVLLFPTMLSNANGQSPQDSIPLFDAAYDYTAEHGPNSLRTIDINGDGILDMVINKRTDIDLEIFCGKANGTFKLLNNFSNGVLCANFDSDIKPDMLLSRNDSLLFAKGNGDGTFQLPSSGIKLYGGKYMDKECVIYDFNNDGKLDIALRVDYGAYHGVSVLIGNGNGTFQNPLQNPIEYSSSGLVMIEGDFNNDSIIDLAVSCWGGISILIGNGNGSFEILQSSFESSKDIKTADLNHDGNLDLVTLRYGNSDGIVVSLGNGDGTFKSPNTFRGLVYDWSVEIADFDQDGNSDLAIPGCKILFGDGGGSFDEGHEYGAGFGYSEGIVAGDFNNDGWPDLAVGTREGRGACFSVIINNGNGIFYNLPSYDVGGAPECVLVKDLNKDGNLDVIAPIYENDSRKITVLLGKSDGTFQPKSDYSIDYSSNIVISDDFNNDNILDLVTSNNTLLGIGDGTFQQPVSITNEFTASFTSGDFNNDGKKDIIDFGIHVFKGNGDGTFQLANTYSSLGSGYTVYMDRSGDWILNGDFNNDGNLDFALTSYSHGHGIAIFLGNGDLSFQSPTYYSTGGYPYCIASGDFNEDGIIDLATADAGQNYVSVFSGKGDGTFNEGVKYKPGGMPVFITSGFVNNDKHQDLVVANVYSGNITILYGLGDGTFEHIEFYGKVGVKALEIGDFNWDGNNDILVTNNSDISILSNLLPRKIPKQINPANEGIVDRKYLNLCWTPIDNAIKYHIQVSSNSLFSNLLYNDSLISTTSIQIGQLENNKTYYWRISSINSDGVSEWSHSFSFSTAFKIQGCPIYNSTNLAGHSIFAECNPGNTTACPCNSTDASITSYASYGVVTANPNKRTTFVNAIGYKKFTDTLLPNLPILAAEYKYSAFIKLPSMPKPDVNQHYNPEAAHLMIQLYDGKNQVWNEGKISVEAAIYWELNPWTSDYGKIKIYCEQLNLVSTGIVLEPDTLWHYLELKADFHKLKYTSISIDDQTVNLSSYNLAKVEHNDWGNDLSLSITTESECASNNCDKVFYWDTYYCNVDFSLLKQYFLENASICAGSSYKGHIVDGIYIDTLRTVCGGDSIVTTVLIVNPIPTITGTTDGSRCGTGTVTFGATASAGTINWYAASTGGSSLGTGTSFTTTSLTTTSVYYVDATNNGCTTATRTAVTAIINAIPTITGTTNGSRCGTGTVTLRATASAGTINWYAASTGGSSLGTGTSFTTPSLTTTTAYYIDATNNGCTTATRTAVTATINAIQTITGTTDGLRCGTGMVTLGATASAGIINWYAASTGGSSLGTGMNFTTPSLTTTTVYYVDATNNDCTIATRTAVTATINAIPTITGTTDGLRCGSGTVTLGATASAGVINWYAASTGGSLLGTGTNFMTPSLTTTTVYYVDATNNDCTTATRTAVTATINAIPTITGTTDGSRCGTGTVTLGATASAGVINWYAASTGGSLLGTGTNFMTPSLTTTTVYYVDATNNGCTTATRTAVTAKDTCTTGINSILSSDKIKVYPNPTTGIVEISINEPIDSDYTIELFNNIGALKQKIIIDKNAKATHIDLSGYPAGLYLMRFDTKSGSFDYKILKE